MSRGEFDVMHMNLKPVEIRLNVYDLSTDLNENAFINTFGLGAFHSAIEFYDREVFVLCLLVPRAITP